MTYGHSPTETVVSILEGTDRDTKLNLSILEEIAAYFKAVRKKYKKFEGSLKGVDSRILVAQVPGGMLTNLENQLREQNAVDRLDEVLEEIPKVRKDLGYLPLVTPTSQIVGSQSVLNVLIGQYKSLTKETEGILKGEYGATPRPVDKELQSKVLNGGNPITCRPADLLQPELNKLQHELEKKAKEKKLLLAPEKIDDVLSYALFPQVALRFFENRNNPTAFEKIPTEDDIEAEKLAAEEVVAPTDGAVYRVTVDGKTYSVEVDSDLEETKARIESDHKTTEKAEQADGDSTIQAPLAGNIFKILVEPGQKIARGDVVIVWEAMKMETEVSATQSGLVAEIFVSVGDKVAVGNKLVSLSF